MAHHDRCLICDYTQAEGSNYAGAAPYSRGKVRKHGEDVLCAVCFASYYDASLELAEPDEVPPLEE